MLAPRVIYDDQNTATFRLEFYAERQILTAARPADEKRELWLKWLEALRNGQYLQARKTLRAPLAGSAYGFCCLGVLCDLKDPKGWLSEDFSSFKCDGMNEEYEIDGEPVVSYINGDLGRYHLSIFGMPAALQNYLIHLNDAGKKFPYIADVIEAFMTQTLEFTDDTGSITHAVL